MISAYITPDVFLQGKLVEGGFPKERMFSLLNPFDVTRYTASYAHEGYFVYLGRIVQEKGIFTLLRAMKETLKSKLMIIGGGEDEGKAREAGRLEGLRNVSFMGPRYGEDLIALLSGALAIIVPSEWYDNSPLVVHQAFALGKPVIASRIDGIPEIVEEGVNGLLFEPGNNVELAEKMNILEENEQLRQDLGRNARLRAEMSFTAKNRFQELTKVMNYAMMNRMK
jgi:glycosyltransferase involved in cell wall biosynthesis